MTIKTTPERTLELLKQAVGERGADFVFPVEWKMNTSDEVEGMCTYVQPRKSGPACIVGYVLHEYGVRLEELAAVEGQTAFGVATAFGADGVSAEILLDAQIQQDGGATWDDAYTYAANNYESRKTT